MQRTTEELLENFWETTKKWCEERDLNPHVRKDTNT